MEKEMKKVIKEEMRPLLIGLRNEIKDSNTLLATIKEALGSGAKGAAIGTAFTDNGFAVIDTGMMKDFVKSISPVFGVDYFTDNDIVSFREAVTPVYGKDYGTEKQIKEIVSRATPIKGKHYFDGVNGKTPIKGTDYFTAKEIADFLKKATPIKGIHYKDGAPGAKGEKGDSGTQISAIDIRNKLESLKGKDRLSIKAIKDLEERLIALASKPQGGGPIGLNTDVLTTTGVTPGTYTSTDLTVDAYGRITAASNGSGGGGGVSSVSGTADRITSSGGATPVIDIAATYVGQASITTLGTIGTGTWQGTAIADSYIASAATWNAKVSSQWTLSSGQLYPTTTTNKVGIGQASATYWLDVLGSTTGMTASSRTVNASLTGGTYNTTGGALSSYAGYFNSNATRASGSNALTNIGIYAEASGAQVNHAAYFNGTTTLQLGTTSEGFTFRNYLAGISAMYPITNTTVGSDGFILASFGSTSMFYGAGGASDLYHYISGGNRTRLNSTNYAIAVNAVVGGISDTPSSKLEVRTNSLGTTQTTSSGLALANTTAAAAGAQQISPALRFSSNGWGTTASTSQDVSFRQYTLPVQAGVPTGRLTTEFSVNGGAYNQVMSISSNGNFLVQNGSGIIQLQLNASDTSIGTAGTQAVTFYTSPSGSRLNVMYLNTDGTVGIGSGTNAPSSKLEVRTNALGTSQTTSSGLALTNTTAAAAGAQQISPAIRWSGKGWKTDATAASRDVDFRSYVVPVQGAANPTGYLTFESSINGAAYSEVARVTNTGVFTTTAGIISGGTVRLKGYTVATLPAGTVGDTAYVTDALAPTFLATVVGGGAVVTPVFYDGTNWVGY